MKHSENNHRILQYQREFWWALATLTIAFASLHRVAVAASPQSFLATRGESKILLVGVTHVSWLRDNDYEPHLTSILGKSFAVAVETRDSTSRDRQALEKISSPQENAKTFFSLPAELKSCIDEAIISDTPIKSLLAPTLKAQHLAFLRIQLSNHRHIAPTIQLRYGLDYLAEKRAAAIGKPVIYLESLRNAYAEDIGASNEILQQDLSAYCKIINDPKLRERYVLLSNRFLLEAHSLPAEKLDLLRTTFEQNLHKDFGLSDLTIKSADKRNAKLAAAAIAANCQYPQLTVLVGLLHLTGQAAIHNQLSVAGYEVKPVSWREAGEKLATLETRRKKNSNECN
jgi:uncharacterized protein YbaP (TraB family)